MAIKKIQTGIIGGAGYTGGELIRLLMHHPQADICFVHSNSHAGNLVSSVHKDLTGDTALVFTDAISQDIDVLFLCLGHGEAKKFLTNNAINDSIKIVDLSQDFRLITDDGNISGKRHFVYGLPELNKEKILAATNIANPGCFATAIQLGLLPLAQAGLLETVHSTGITGATGAGQGLSATSHFSWRANNIQAYKALQHQHLGEIHQSLDQLQGGFSTGNGISFVPWRGDFTRGIYVSSVVTCPLNENEVISMYDNFYERHPFTIISSSMIDVKQVVNTNKCLVHVEKVGNRLAIHTAIDNLLKGASGQAVQNMNLLFGLQETTGLLLKANYF
jgi:N-acetyl-gamma-glutamyl-phosphate reductase